MFENTDSEFFKAEIRMTKEGAEYVLDVLEEAGLEDLTPESIPMSALLDFIAGKRKNIWEITVNGNTVMDVVTTKKGAQAMVEMVKEKGGDKFPLVPIPMDNFVGVVQGKNKNVMTIEMVHLSPNAEMPGHV